MVDYYSGLTFNMNSDLYQRITLPVGTTELLTDLTAFILQVPFDSKAGLAVPLPIDC